MRAVVPFLFLILAGHAWAAEVPYVTEAMRTPSFWISRHPSPDTVVMSPSRIAGFNRRLQAEGLTDDLAAIVPYPSAAALKELIMAQAGGVLGRELFRADGAVLDATAKAVFTRAMALGTLRDGAALHYAFTTRFADERLLPTSEPLYAKPGDVDFDEVQNSGLDPCTPLVVLHTSADGQWFFVKDGITSGWVQGADIGFVEEKVWRQMVAGSDRVTVIAPRAEIFEDTAMRTPVGAGRMGASFNLRRVKSGAVEIVYPRRSSDGTAVFHSGFMRPADVVRGVLLYTPRTVITQAFKLLDAPYGWGDMHGRQDCSRFIQMVFATLGLHLPRNSTEQGRSGVPVAGVEPGLDAPQRAAVIAAEGLGGLTLLRLKGHIMLYLGEAVGRLYAIHAMWAYREKKNDEEVTHVIGRVAVSDLSLGEGASKGSLLQRIVAVVRLQEVAGQFRQF